MANTIGAVSHHNPNEENQQPERPRRAGRLLFALGLAAILVGYGILKLYGLGPSLSDENIYYYMARATALRGALPYRDYFFAHPPLHLVPLIVVARIFPHSYTALQVVPMISGAIAALFLSLLAYRAWGPLAALLTASLYLFNRQVLSGTSHDTGMDIAVALVAIALYFALAERPLWGGIVFGLAGLAGVYALAGAVAIAAVLALGGWRRLRPFAIGLGATWVGGNLAAWALGGNAYWRDVYLYPMRVPPGQFGLPFGETLTMVVVFNFIIGWAAVIGVALWTWDAGSRWWRRRQEARAAPRRRRRQPPPAEEPPWWRALAVEPEHRVTAGALVYLIATVLFFATRGNLAQYYFMLPFPGLALLGGRGAERLIAALAAAFPARREMAVAPWRATALFAIVLLAAGAGARLGLGATRTVQANLSAGAKEYHWSDAPLIGPLNRLVRALFWRDTSRPGRVYGAVQEYLWLRSYKFETAREIARYVRARTAPDDTIFGDMLVAPVVALLAHRRLAGDVADTSEVRFRSGMYTVEECWRMIDRERPVYIIVLQKGSLPVIPGFAERLVTWYGPRPVRSFKDPGVYPGYGEIGVFRRLPRAIPPPQPPDR